MIDRINIHDTSNRKIYQLVKLHMTRYIKQTIHFFCALVFFNLNTRLYSMQIFTDTYKNEYILAYKQACTIPKSALRFLFERQFADNLEPEILQARLTAIMDVLDGQPNQFIPLAPRNIISCR